MLEGLQSNAAARMWRQNWLSHRVELMAAFSSVLSVFQLVIIFCWHGNWNSPTVMHYPSSFDSCRFMYKQQQQQQQGIHRFSFPHDLCVPLGYLKSRADPTPVTRHITSLKQANEYYLMPSSLCGLHRRRSARWRSPWRRCSWPMRRSAAWCRDISAIPTFP